MSTFKDKTGAEVEVIRDDALGAFAIKDVATGQTMGRTFYVDVENGGATDRIYFHTEVPEAFGGRGLATILVEQALRQTNAAGLITVALCPMVRGYLSKHPDAGIAVRTPTTSDITAVNHYIEQASH